MSDTESPSKGFADKVCWVSGAARWETMDMMLVCEFPLVDKPGETHMVGYRLSTEDEVDEFVDWIRGINPDIVGLEEFKEIPDGLRRRIEGTPREPRDTYGIKKLVPILMDAMEELRPLLANAPGDDDLTSHPANDILTKALLAARLAGWRSGWNAGRGEKEDREVREP